jgi:anti-sigma-K factor RskA
VKLLRHDLHILTGAYALDALQAAERERFEHHLQRCQPCSHEVRGLHETATRLALAVAEPPPPELRERVLTAVSKTRQHPPVMNQRPVPPQPRSAWVPRLAGIAAAVAVAVAVTLGITQSVTQSRLDRVQAQEQAMEAVLTAPDARIVSHRSSVGGTATVVFSEAKHKMIFTTAGLPPLPGDKVYELWLMAPGGNRRAGLLPAPRSGRTAPVLATGLAAGDQAGVTVEPAGGSPQPTTTPILAVPLAG